jgi:hypothetical protein
MSIINEIDFASLYPSTFTMKLGPRKKIKRKNKIIKIFNYDGDR